MLFPSTASRRNFVFKIGDVREGLMAIGRSLGLTPEQMQKLDAKARESAK
jgi:phage terminase small subunit